jgi:hypothetical protein
VRQPGSEDGTFVTDRSVSTSVLAAGPGRASFESEATIHAKTSSDSELGFEARLRLILDGPDYTADGRSMTEETLTGGSKAAQRLNMTDLVFKIVLPVGMIAVVTVVSHRYGPAIGGILGTVPSKGGPVLLFLAIEQGPSFAATAAATAIGGAGGCGVFCLVYARVCGRVGWPLAGAAAYGAFAATWAVMLLVSSIGLWATVVATFAILLISRRLLPAAPPITGRRATAATELPARMIAGAGMVVFVTTAGPGLGAVISGLLATIPTVAAVLALFTHAEEGPERTIGVMRGMTHGLLGFASFLTVLAATLEPLGVTTAFALAAAAVAAVQIVELSSAVRSRKPVVEAEVQGTVAAE